MLKLEILMSCMHQTDLSLIEESNITGDVLMINQAETELIEEIQQGNQRIRKITTAERGLSRSRNMAIQNALGDICLLCDDDECLEDGYESLIVEAFECNPDADVIAFQVTNKKTRLKKKKQKLGYLDCLKLASYQIAFRRRAIVDKNIQFDPLMGAGSGNGGGEENKFLWDCLRCGLSIYYVPVTIAVLLEKTSTWFFGYDRKFFYQRGAVTRYMMGIWLSVFYGIYYILRKRALYQDEISMLSASKALFQGILENPIACQKREQDGENKWIS